MYSSYIPHIYTYCYIYLCYRYLIRPYLCIPPGLASQGTSAASPAAALASPPPWQPAGPRTKWWPFFRPWSWWNRKTMGKPWENHRKMGVYPLVMSTVCYWKSPIKIVDFPIENGGSFHSYVKLPEGIHYYPIIIPFKNSIITIHSNMM